MTRTAAARRPGLSLLEVIVALFVMALGMISLLTLFPLGAIQMGQALRDARAAETCSQADTHMRLWWQRDVVERPGTEDPAFAALDHPSRVTGFDTSHPFGSGPTEVGALTATDLVPSYPLMIDPIGWQAYPLPTRRVRLAGNISPRRTMNWITSSGNPFAFSFRTATMMDDITFNQAAVPDTASTTVLVGGQPTVARQGRYNWAAVIQRPVNANRYVADLKILVFDGRSPGIAPADAELVLLPQVPAVPAPNNKFFAGQAQISLVSNSLADHLRAGNWIMDGTLTPPPAVKTPGVRNAVWYRIQSIDIQKLQPHVRTPVLDRSIKVLRPSTSNRLFL